jgi:cystathionine beta-lyase family protein involved in aluminum resistance
LDPIKTIRLAEKVLAENFAQLEETAYLNQAKVLKAFQKNQVRDYHFHTYSSGYGYNDLGREVLESIYAQVFSAPSAIVRSQIVSGTHAISACLFGILRPGDELVSLTGAPYDTLAGIIKDLPGCLSNQGIKYREVPLDQEGKPHFEAIQQNLSAQCRMVILQRSRGYSLRPALTVQDIEALVKLVKSINKDIIVFVDNCYGEFVEELEPLDMGADLIAGSLIKNPGGGLAPAGGYICGRSDLVEQISWHLTAPGLGKELGAGLVDKRWFYQGLFIAPHTVLQALKGSILLAYLLEQERYQVSPRWNETRGDIVQAVIFDDPLQVLKFCQVIQNSSPVDSDVKLEYGRLPGYKDGIVMAAGTFVQGSSIELSCDAPRRSPYCAYLQGGLSYEHIRYTAVQILNMINEQRL